MVPHSRHTTVLREEIEQVEALRILASSEEAGVFAVSTRHGRQIFITGHPEYDPDTLRREYLRDRDAGKSIEVPKNYFRRTTSAGTAGGVAGARASAVLELAKLLRVPDHAYDISTIQ